MYNRNRFKQQVTVKSVILPELGADTFIYGEIENPNMRYFNPSIAWHNEDLKIAIRSCNFAINQQGHYYFRDGSIYSKTDVIYGDLNPDTLQVRNLEKLKLVDAPMRTLVSGLEDVRIFSRKDGMHAIGFESDRLTRSLHNGSAKLAEYLIDKGDLKHIRTLEKPHKEIVEKNWSPTDKPSKYFDFTYSDSQIWKDGKIIGNPTKTQIHGGSQLLKQKDGAYLSIVHDKTADRMIRSYDRYTYNHYLAKHGKDGIVTKLSKPFRFGTNEKIEFAGGMVEYNEDFIISFGIRDCKYGITRVNKEKMMVLFD